MSSSGSGDDSGPGTREVAHRLFAAEFDDASLEYSESDEERAPNYVVTPTGLRVNRLFAVGVLTEVESVNEETVRGRVVDPTGAFVTYAGQYQPDELAFLDRTTPPAFVALTGKARTFQPDDSDIVYTSVRPESVSAVDAETRDRWTVSAAEATLDRLAVLAAALELEERGDALRARLEAAGAPDALAAGIPRAIEHYGTTGAYVEAVRRLAVDALEVVAGDRDEVRSLTTEPDAAGPAEIGPLPDHGLDLAATPDEPAEVEAAPAEAEAATTEPVADASEAGEAASTDGEAAASTASTAESAASATSATSATNADADADTDADDAAEVAEAAAAGGTDSAVAAEVDEDVGTGPSTDAGGEAGTDPAGSTAAAATEDEADAVATEPDDGEPAESTAAADVQSDASADSDEGLGDFDDGDLGDFEDTGPEDFEDAISDEERREVEEEHGVEFSSGSEVSEPGEAGIETPTSAETGEVESDEEAAEPDATESEASQPAGTASASESTDGAEADSEPTEGAETEDAGTGDAEDDVGETADTADVDLEDAVVDLMDELDDGDGASREAVVSTAAERYGASEDEADDAVQDALMSGKCYEPSEGTLKSI